MDLSLPKAVMENVASAESSFEHNQTCPPIRKFLKKRSCGMDNGAGMSHMTYTKPYSLYCSDALFYSLHHIVSCGITLYILCLGRWADINNNITGHYL